MKLDERIYYEDQDSWTPTDYQGLWRYLNRLLQFMGPTAAAEANPDELYARIQVKRAGKRDAEIAAMDLTRMSEDTRYLLKHLLIYTERFEQALQKYPNLRGLRKVGTLDHQLVLDEDPSYVNEYFTRMGILL